MDAILNINSNAAAFGDQNLSNNPKRRFFDWTRNMNGLRIKNPKANTLTLYPGESRLVFDGKRTLGADVTTQWDSKSLGSGVYRLSWNAVGTHPGLRTARAIPFVGIDITVSINNNSTVTMACSSNCFQNVQAGDNLYISLPTDSGPKPFNPANGGFWVVLSASPNAITLARPVGQSFNAAAETVVVTNTNLGPILAYSSTGVQVGDTVDINAGFQVPVQKSYEVLSVTSQWFEVSSVSPLPEEAAVQPGTTGITFYTSAKTFMRVEADQDALVYFNGYPVGVRIIPVLAGDPGNMGWFENTGVIWTLTVINRSQNPLNLNVFSAE
jgi:hypothetical protein